MSLKEVAGDFVTPAQLSRFENGKSNLSVDTFLLLETDECGRGRIFYPLPVLLSDR